MLNFFRKLADQVTGKTVDWEQLEADLIQSDFGARFAVDFVDQLKKKQRLFEGREALELAREEVQTLLQPGEKMVTLRKPLHVVLLVGVNGVGKTTSAAKLARYYQKEGKHVRLVAADTFRAAAIEQLELWGKRLGVPVTAGRYGGDPAAVAFTGVETAQKENADVVIVDTAGRQHTKSNLMQELDKVVRTLKKIDPKAPDEILLVIDSNTGSNALNQAREFGTAVSLTGLIASKFDGSGLGGALVAIAQECRVYPRWLGVGEGMEDLMPFSVESYVKKLLEI